MMNYAITLELNPKSDGLQVLGDGIMQFTSQKTHHKPMEFFAVFIRKDKKEILGGCSGSTLYGCLYIDTLWINESIRQQSVTLSDSEIKGRKTWYQKMLARAEVGDLEGKYRQIWVIYILLEDYFAFRKLCFMGPKKA